MRQSMLLDAQPLSRLRQLIRVNIDSRQCFHRAADTLEDPELTALFLDYARQRRAFAHEIEQYLNEPREEPLPRTGSRRGTLHRWWLDLRARLSDSDRHTVLAELERGEEQVRRLYEQALAADELGPAGDVIDRQYDSIRKGHERLRSLRDAYAVR